MAAHGRNKKRENGVEPKRAVPQYIRNERNERNENLLSKAPPGHRFLLYFKGWDVGDKKRDALKEVCGIGDAAKGLLKALCRRQADLANGDRVLSIYANTTSPVATGLGNPHAVENGFAFLSPYGVPYLPASGIKGVVRRAAEELALFDGGSPWTIPLVWALFGFEAGSAYLADASAYADDVLKEEAGRWRRAFRAWLDDEADTDPLLSRWLLFAGKKGEEAPKPSHILRSWQSEQKTRKDVHWQGMLRFWDAFPPESAELDVDILNPHHKDYYNGNSAPHDSEPPKPVFFLVIKPGASFRFIVEMKGRAGLAELVPDWRGLVRAAFERAFGWLGFGAKTAVGYGAMEIDREAEDRQKREEEAREREAEKKRTLEKERRRKEELEALPEAERLKSMDADNEGEAFANSKCYPKLDSLDGVEKIRLAEALKDFYQRMGKWEGKQSNKQETKVQKIKQILGE